MIPDLIETLQFSWELLTQIRQIMQPQYEAFCPLTRSLSHGQSAAVNTNDTSGHPTTCRTQLPPTLCPVLNTALHHCHLQTRPSALT